MNGPDREQQADDGAGMHDDAHTGGDSPAMAMLMQSMEAALGGLAKHQQEAADQVPKIRAEHDRLEAELAKAYQAEDFETYQRVSDQVEALERIWQMTLQTIGPDPESFGLPAHPTLVDPDR